MPRIPLFLTIFVLLSGLQAASGQTLTTTQFFGDDGTGAGGSFTNNSNISVTDQQSALIIETVGTPEGTAPLSGTNNGRLSLTNSASGEKGLAFRGIAQGARTFPVVITNNGPILLQGTFPNGVGGIEVESVGGNGSNNDDGQGQAGGEAGAIFLRNNAPIQLGSSLGSISGAGNAQGLHAYTQGGQGGTGDSSGAGGPAGPVTITNSAPINLFWNTTGSSKFYGIEATSTGGNTSSNFDDSSSLGNEVPGGSAGPLAITLTKGGDVQIVSNLAVGEAAGIGLVATGGNGVIADTDSTGGTGGFAGSGSTPSTIQVIDASVRAFVEDAPAISAIHRGGVGGEGGDQKDYSNGGDGGGTGAIEVTVNAETVPIRIITEADKAAGIFVGNFGGNGAQGTDYDNNILGVGGAGNGGAGGDTGHVTISLNGDGPGSNIFIDTTGALSPGVEVLSRGGLAGRGGNVTGNASIESEGSTGGAGGDGGNVTITLGSGNGSRIRTRGVESPGIIAQSIGSDGGSAGSIISAGDSGKSGGAGGNAGDVAVTSSTGSRVVTLNERSPGIVAQSLSGAGGDGGTIDNSGGGTAGPGGAGGATGTVTVTNNGDIFTGQLGSPGILAQTISGAGGTAGSASGFFYAAGGTGGSSGAVNEVKVVQSASGRIVTLGQSSNAAELQSIAGGGGSGGSASGGIDTVGGSASTNTVTSNAGNAIASLNGTLITTGENALGVLVQSVGGGGGNAGSNSGWFTVGGSGGAGGAGGMVEVNKTGGGVIFTQGQLSHGFVGQSIGGGGGNAGNATSLGFGVSASVGGSGGDGGAGGSVSATMGDHVLIRTSGSNSAGGILQSIGGGGGTAGSAYATAGSVGFSAALAVGGSGGSGGAGQDVTYSVSFIDVDTGLSINNAMTSTNLLPIDSFGFVAQSIGGGGGLGGSASAQALAAAIPIPDTDTMISASLSAGVGGSGGTGGSGGQVTVLLGTDTSITTQGQGSHGVLAQSIGGGGGAGGDSSASSATVGYKVDPSFSLALDLSLSAGGAGGIAGDGGEVDIAIGGTSTSSASGQASVTTYGDFANAIVAQSIGGGGGNAGFGSSNTQDRGSTASLGIGVSLGASGGAGGTGGPVTVSFFPGTLNTYGSGAHGILAQSIGGGGGASQGGSLNLNASLTSSGEGEEAASDGEGSTYDATLTINLGGNGAAGSNGGTVTVTSEGNLTTRGNDAPGILAQSIGGGGGLAGSAGNDASADNPIDSSTGERRFSPRDDDDNTYSANLELNLGGRGGSGGNSNNVTVDHSGRITTSGDWSHGIVAQSIGGGGGKGGSAVSAAAESTPDVTLALAKGGSGGAGGSAEVNGASAVTKLSFNGGAINTSGFAAFGALAQSIGGGGGLAADGSDQSNGKIDLATSSDGSPGISGSGGDVTVNGSGGMIGTTGIAAHGLVLQSIGGGGGLAGLGNGNTDFSDNSSSVSVGGSTVRTSPSGRVAISSDTSVTISTNGDNASALIAQSIGGGGGLALVLNPDNATLNGTSDESSIGGEVSITPGPNSAFDTTGHGAHGIIAQSIGGGGGIAGDVFQGGPLQRSAFSTTSANSATLASGLVEVTLNNSAVSTSGDYAHGIIAQSIAGGGGIQAEDGNLIFGGLGGPGGAAVASNAIRIGIGPESSVGTTGEGSIGIFAQSVGTAFGGNITIAVEGIVSSLGQDATGIWIDGGRTNNLVIASGATVEAPNGSAVMATNDGASASAQITNNGTITGSMTNSESDDVSAVANFGTVNAGTDLQFVFTNFNLLRIGVLAPLRTGNPFQPATGFSRTTLTEDFVQTAGGTLAVDVDFNTGLGDRLLVRGDATLDGRILPTPTSVVREAEVPVLEVEGSLTGTIDGTPQGADSAIFTYAARQRGNTITLRPTGADFTPDNLVLASNASGVAGHLQAVWNQAPNPLLGPLLATLSDTATRTPGDYNRQLSQLSPGAQLGLGARRTVAAESFANESLSFPLFIGDGALLEEGPTTWARTTGRTETVASENGVPGFTFNTTTWQAGGQGEFAPDWFLGGSLGYEYSWLDGATGSVDSHGHTALGSVTLKHQRGPWLFAAAAYGSAGFYESERAIQLPGISAVAESAPNVQSAGFLVRASYQWVCDRFYLRPSATVSTTTLFANAYTESGAGGLGLAVDSRTETLVTGTPQLEAGARFDLGEGQTLRAFGAIGVSLSSDDQYQQSARFRAAPTGGFTTAVPIADVVGKLTLGAQYDFDDTWSLQAKYEGAFAEQLSSHGGSLGFALQF